MLKKKTPRSFRDLGLSCQLRLTPRRAQIWTAFRQTDHVTAKQLLQYMKESDPHIGLDAVYRIMGQFRKAGLVTTRRYRSETYFDSSIKMMRRDLLICISCNAAVPIYKRTIMNLTQAIALQHGYLLQYYKLELYGTCQHCILKPNAANNRDILR